MRCLCCGKEIKVDGDEKEKVNRWHNKCIKSFFGTKELPKLNISEQELERLASESVNHGLTVPGVQKKLSLHLTNDDKPRLTIVNYPTGYILKPQTDDFDFLPESEYLCMQMAEIVGIQTVPNALIKIDSIKDKYAYITKRIDRNIDNDIIMYAMEDFCQLSNRLTQDKYRGSYERCAKIINQYSVIPGLDLSELLLRLIFCFVTGNSDMHLKNFSLIENKPKSREFVLSKAYDLIPVNIIMPEDTENFALTMNGKKRNIRKKDFYEFAKISDIPEKTVDNIIKKIIDKESEFLVMIENSYISIEMKEAMKQLLRERINIIKQ